MTISRPFWGLKGPLCFFSYVHPLDNKYVHCPFCSVIDFFYYFLKITLNDNNLFHDLYLWAKRIFLTYLLSFDDTLVWVGQNNGYSLTNSNRILLKRINVLLIYIYFLFYTKSGLFLQTILMLQKKWISVVQMKRNFFGINYFK